MYELTTRKRSLFSLTIVLLLILLSSVSYAKNLKSYNVDQKQISVSGLSSGAFMATQFHVAFSSDIMGAGIVAGGPFYCSCENSFVAPIVAATTTCMNPCKVFGAFGGCDNPMVAYPDGQNLANIASKFAELDYIDELTNLKKDNIYIFSGKDDEVVLTSVVDQTYEFYTAAGVSKKNIEYNKKIAAGHAFITDNTKDTKCSKTESPYLNDCGFIQSHRILEHIYGELNPPGDGTKGNLVEFSQKEFIDSPISSMSDQGYAYIPDDCLDNTCRVHVVFHGCKQSVSAIGKKLIEDAGYNQIAETNRIIILYPQLVASPTIPFNPLGCWDFWGYSSFNEAIPDFYQKSAPQMAAVKKMIDRVSGQTPVEISQNGK